MLITPTQRPRAYRDPSAAAQAVDHFLAPRIAPEKRWRDVHWVFVPLSSGRITPVFFIMKPELATLRDQIAGHGWTAAIQGDAP